MTCEVVLRQPHEPPFVHDLVRKRRRRWTLRQQATKRLALVNTKRGDVPDAIRVERFGPTG